ncbi:MAG: PPC domain-containing protein [Anaerolineales bacterium]|nr:PPC domain-containing protein [Anaerolineales bacterium]
MRKAHLSCILAGFLLVVSVSCWPIDDNEILPATVEPLIDVQPTEPATASLPIVPQPPPSPTPFPTVTTLPLNSLPETWQEMGNSTLGLTLASPAPWVKADFNDDIAQLASRLEQTDLLLVANTAATGAQLLSQQKIESGGFALGFQSSTTPATVPPILDIGTTTDPVAGLEMILSRANITNATAVPLSLVNSPGAYVDITQDPTGLVLSQQTAPARLRLALFIKPETGTLTFVLMGATADLWPSYEAIFDYMVETIVIYDQLTGTPEGLRFLNTSPAQGNRDSVISQLEKDKIDFWIFNTEQGRYATITLAPGSGSSDLTLTLLSPSGRTIAQQDNGYGGDTEVLADVLLPESGSYIIQVAEFFNEADSYTLSVAISDEPVYSGGGRIEIGQEIEATLRPNGEDIWTFSGAEGGTISLVLTPMDDFDALFTLFAPDGSEIRTSDEGYSGDTEIFAGYTLPVTGDYTVVVNSFGENGGTYSLAIDEDSQEVGNYYDAGDLAYGAIEREILRTDEVHAWFVNGRAGDEIALGVRPLNDILDLDVWLVILDEDSVRRLDMRDETLAGEMEQIDYVLPRDGQYLVLVQDFFGEAGEYEIELTVSGENYLVTAGELLPNQTIEATLPSGRGAVWTFSGAEGDTISIELVPDSPEIDLVMSLRDPNDRPAVQVDDTLAGNPERLEAFTLTAEGTWLLVVQEYYDAGGNYTLTLTVESTSGD